MANRVPRKMPTQETIFFDGSQSPQNLYSIEDTVSVIDTAIFEIHKIKYLVKKQIGKVEQIELPVWLDEITNQGWELISHSVKLGFYIFKKTA